LFKRKGFEFRMKLMRGQGKKRRRISGRIIRLKCDFMLSSESKNTPRSRTIGNGDLMLDPSTRMSFSTDEIFLRFVADPKHITSVFLVFSWRRFDAHQMFTDVTQAPSPAVTSRTLDSLLYLMPCMSSANRWWRTRCCSKTLVTYYA